MTLKMDIQTGGKGGSTSGRAMAFCPSGPGSNLGVFISDVINLL